MAEELEQEVGDSRLTEEFLSDLHDFMDKEEVKELEINVDDETFKITSREQANFFIRKLQESREQKEQINKTADAEINRLMTKITRWREAEIRKCESAEYYFSALLEQFAAKELEGSDKKSLKLPFGTLSFKKQQDKYDYDDEALLAFLKEKKLNDYVQTKESPKKAELKKVGTVKDGKLYVNGVEIEGITITVQEDKFEVK